MAFLDDKTQQQHTLRNMTCLHLMMLAGHHNVCPLNWATQQPLDTFCVKWNTRVSPQDSPTRLKPARRRCTQGLQQRPGVLGAAQ